MSASELAVAGLYVATGYYGFAKGILKSAIDIYDLAKDFLNIAKDFLINAKDFLNIAKGLLISAKGLLKVANDILNIAIRFSKKDGALLKNAIGLLIFGLPCFKLQPGYLFVLGACGSK